MLMDFVPLNKEKSTIKSPDKKIGEPKALADFFVAAFLKAVWP